MGMFVLLWILLAGVVAVLVGLIVLIVLSVKWRESRRTFTGTAARSRSGSSDDAWMYASGAAGVADSGSTGAGTHADDEARRHAGEAVAGAGAVHLMATDSGNEVSSSHCGGAFDSGSGSFDSGSSCSSDSGSSSSSSSGD